MTAHARGAGTARQDERSLAVVLYVVLLAFALYRFFQLAVYPIARGQHAGDFAVFIDAAQRLASGGPLYTDPGAPRTYLYPPTLALLLLPLVGARPAFLVFTGLGVLAIAVSIVLLARLSRGDWRPAALVLGVIALSAWPVQLHVRQGQVDAMTLALMVAALVLAYRGRDRWSALALGMAISLKVTPGVLVIYWLWKRRYRLALESLVAGGVIVLLGGLVVGPGNLVGYVTQVLPRIGGEGSGYWYNQSLHSTLLRLFASNSFSEPVADLGLRAVTMMAGLLSAVLLAATLWSVGRGWPAAAYVFLAEAGAFMALEVLAASLSWQMHAVWLLVPLAALVLYLRDAPKVPRWMPLAVGLAAIGFVAGPYEPPFEYGRFAFGWANILIAHTVAAALLLLGLCLYTARRERAAQAPPPAPGTDAGEVVWAPAEAEPRAMSVR